MKGVDPEHIENLAMERGGTITPINAEVLGVANKDKPSRRKPRPKAKPEADNDPREPGSVICEGVVLGRAVPWKEPPAVGRRAFLKQIHSGSDRARQYRRYLDWQGTVRGQAEPLMARRKPYGGPVSLDMVFYLNPRGGTPPDPTNLQKAFEDALQGVVFVNDTQVQDVRSRRIIDRAEEQRVEFVVRAI